MHYLVPLLLLQFVLATAAHSAVFWTDSEPADHLWTSTGNWNTGSLPTSIDEVQFNTANTSAEISAGMVAETGNFILGRHALDTQLTVSGGTLTTNGSIFFIAQYDDASGTLNVSGGTITINSELSVSSAGPGTLSITNGDIIVNGPLKIGRYSNPEAIGLLELNGGTITATSFSMNAHSSMTVDGGAIIIDGDATTTIQGFINGSQISSAQSMYLDYNDTNPGKTTLSNNAPPPPPPPGPNITRDIGTAGPAYTHPRLYFSAADKPDILARRVNSAYYTAVAQPRIQNAVSGVNNSSWDALANANLSTPDWALIEATFNGNEGRNQNWAIASMEAYLTDDTVLADRMIKIITNYSRIVGYTKDLSDGVYASSVVSPTFYNYVRDRWTRVQYVDPTYFWNWDLSEQWAFGGFGLAVAYDTLYHEMTAAEQDVVRDALATATAGRYSYGATMPKGRGVSNHYGYHGELATMLLAVRDETGFDPAAFSRIRQVLLDYWEVGFTPDGYCHEDTYGPNLGLREGTRGLLALARDNAADNIFIGQKYIEFGNAIAQQIESRENGYLLGGASGVDQANHPGAAANIYPTSLIILKYMRPNDPVADYVWRWVIGNNHGNTFKGQSAFEYCHFGLDVYSNFLTPNTLDGSGLPLTDFSPRRGKLVTRSDWTQDATYLQFDARPDAFSIGHDKVDRGNFYLTALNRQWVVNPPWNVAKFSDYQSLIHIDGLAQPWKAPSVEFLSHSDNATHVQAAADLSYAYDWEWTPPWPSSTSNYSAPWEPELSDPRDLGWPDDPAWLPNKIHGEPGIGYVGSYMHRRPFNGVNNAFRSMVMSRGPNPYVLLVDDIKKDSSAHAYRWQIALPSDVSITSQSGRDIVLGRSSEPSGAKLLVRIIEANDTSGNTPATITGSLATTTLGSYSSNVLQFTVNSITPEFKVLFFPYNTGDPLPTNTYTTNTLTLNLPDGQSDQLTFSQSPEGQTTTQITSSLTPTLTFTATDTTTSEWGSPADPAEIQLNLDKTVPAPLEITFTTTGSATLADCTGITATATIPANSLSAAFTVQAIDDELAEGPEVLTLDVPSSPSYNLPSPQSLTLDLLDRPYDQWRFTNGLAANSPFDDVNGNGLPLLVDYAYGGNLNDPNPKWSIDINAAEFTFTNPVPSDITTALTWSTDLETWFTTGVVPTANGFDLPAPLGAAFFFRISVTK